MTGLRQALRTVRRQSGSAAVVVVTLAVAIAATTIIASLVEFLLHAIPIADPSRLAMVSSTDPRPSQAQSGMSGGVALSGTSVADLVDWSARSRTVAEFIAFRYDSATSLMVLAQSSRIAVVATVIGVALAVALGRLGEAMLFGVTALDVRAQGGAAALMLAVALLAGVVPARRAAAVDPVEALRAE